MVHVHIVHVVVGGGFRLSHETCCENKRIQQSMPPREKKTPQEPRANPNNNSAPLDPELLLESVDLLFGVLFRAKTVRWGRRIDLRRLMSEEVRMSTCAGRRRGSGIFGKSGRDDDIRVYGSDGSDGSDGSIDGIHARRRKSYESYPFLHALLPARPLRPLLHPPPLELSISRFPQGRIGLDTGHGLWRHLQADDGATWGGGCRGARCLRVRLVLVHSF